jgi:hypothetical protein
MLCSFLGGTSERTKQLLSSDHAVKNHRSVWHLVSKPIQRANLGLRPANLSLTCYFIYQPVVKWNDLSICLNSPNDQNSTFCFHFPLNVREYVFKTTFCLIFTFRSSLNMIFD